MATEVAATAPTALPSPTTTLNGAGCARTALMGAPVTAPSGPPRPVGHIPSEVAAKRREGPGRSRSEARGWASGRNRGRAQPSQTASATEARGAARAHPRKGRGRPVRRSTRLVLPLFLALLALPLVTAAHDSRSAPYGDHLRTHARVQSPTAEPRLQKKGRAIAAYDKESGRIRWTYTREGRRPLQVLLVPGHAIALWDDGIVTDTDSTHGRAVRWHRAVPGATDWLTAPAARDGAGALRTLDPEGRMLAVLTPGRILAFRSADGDLRWVLPARPGCAFEPARALRHGPALVVAQPCATDASWTEQLIAVDDLGRIAPDRKPLGNELPGTTRKKVVAHPR